MDKLKQTSKREEVAEFSLNMLLQAAIVIVVIAVVVIIGIDVVSDFGDDFSANTAERNASDDSVTALGNITSKLGTLVTAIVGIVIIGIIIRLLGGFGGGRGLGA